MFGFVEVHHRGPLDCQSSIGFLFDIGRVFFWKERGIGRFSWALQDPARNHPPCMEPHGKPVVHTCLFFMKGPVLHVDDGSYWSTMVSGGLDLILQCWSAGTSCAPRFRPWVAVKTSGEPALRWTISILSSAACFLAWSSRTSWSAWDH